MKEILLASNNRHKIDELQAILSEYGYRVISPADLNLSYDVAETGTTFEENSFIKAKYVYDLVHIPVVADDSGLAIDALDGRPGIFSSRYAGENASDEMRIEKVLKEMGNTNNRTARFICAITFYSGERVFTVTGKCEGSISLAPSGNNGFGYDPIFIPNGYGDTFAQLDQSIKNEISHRANAISLFVNELNDLKERQ